MQLNFALILIYLIKFHFCILIFLFDLWWLIFRKCFTKILTCIILDVSFVMHFTQQYILIIFVLYKLFNY